MGTGNGENAKPLSEWQSVINRDLLTLHQFMLLRTRKEDEESRKQMAPWFKTLADSVADIEQTTRQLQRYVAEEEARLAQLKILQKSVAIQKERVALMKTQIPSEVSDCLGLNSKQDSEMEEPKKENEQILNSEKQETQLQKKEPASDPASKPKLTRKQSRTNSRKGKAKSELKDEPTFRTDIPVINSVSQEELDAAPQYVKGRLTLEKIDGVVQSLNTIASSKYELLGRPYRDLNSNEITTWQDFRENECDETNGKHFLTDSEIKGFGGCRLDATAKSVINILRHVGALKEVRGRNKARIFIIN